MSSIQKVARQALVTFAGKDASRFVADFEVLRSLVNKVTNNDINLEEPLNEAKQKPFSAPVSYVNICESPHFTIGVFILRSGVSIPLHDHPGMHGLCKVLYGAVKVRSYDYMPSSLEQINNSNGSSGTMHEKLVRCRINEDKVFSPASDVCSLTPNRGNYHSVQAYNGQAAFLDVLAPPYATGERDCSYYEELNAEEAKKLSAGDDDSNIKWLVEIPQPLDFYCDSTPYEGPAVHLEL